jgi:hypothetical protein
MKIRSISYNAILFFFLSVLLIACSKNSSLVEPQIKYSELVIGKWINTLVNSDPILTDASFVMELRSDNIQLYATGFQLDDSNKTWKENYNYTYSINGDILIIDGTDVLNKTYHMEFKILTLDQSTLTYSVAAFLINGVAYPNSNMYTCKRSTDDFSEKFTGVWFGKCTSEGTSDLNYHYWEYFKDSTYNYYYQDSNNNWIRKSDNEGRYFLYGNLFTSNYSNDLISGGTGLAFECWTFSIDGNMMTWTGLRENGKIVTYEMEKVANPPFVP